MIITKDYVDNLQWLVNNFQEVRTTKNANEVLVDKTYYVDVESLRCSTYGKKDEIKTDFRKEVQPTKYYHPTQLEDYVGI